MPNWVGIAVAAALGIINLVYLVTRNRTQDFTALRETIGKLQERVSVMEAQIGIFWKGVSFSSSQALHSPHTPELDALIEAFQDGTIDDGGLARFKVMLEELAEDGDETRFRRKMARDVLTLIQIRYEVAAPPLKMGGGEG